MKKGVFLAAALLTLNMAVTWSIAADKNSVLLESAISGDMDDQYRIARLFEDRAYEADLVAPDQELLEKAVHWNEQAASQGHDEARKKLLTLYRASFEKPMPSWEQKWLSLANEMAYEGDISARYMLAETYFWRSYSEDYTNPEHLGIAVYWYSRLAGGAGPGNSVILSKMETFGKEVRVENIKSKLSILYDHIEKLGDAQRAQIEKALRTAYAR